MSCPHDGNVSKWNAVEIKHKSIVKYRDDMRLYKNKDMKQVQRAKETDKAHTTLIR